MHAGFGRLKEKNVQAQVGPQMDCVFDRVVQMRPGGIPSAPIGAWAGPLAQQDCT